MSKGKKSTPSSGSALIARNKRATYDYHVDEKFEAGIVLQGWEVKSLRAGRVQLVDGFVQVLGQEAWLYNCTITPLVNASTHVVAEARRPRKLLLHRREIDRLVGAVERRGYTLVAMALYWRRGNVKLEFGIGKGKKAYDKRASIKERDWQRDKQRMIRVH